LSLDGRWVVRPTWRKLNSAISTQSFLAASARRAIEVPATLRTLRGTGERISCRAPDVRGPHSAVNYKDSPRCFALSLGNPRGYRRWQGARTKRYYTLNLKHAKGEICPNLSEKACNMSDHLPWNGA
jgi:hypothetical protein